MRPIPAPTFVTDDYVFRPLRLRDAWAVYRALKDPEMTRHVPGPTPYRFRHALKFCVQSVLGRRRGKRVDYAYIYRPTGELIGCRMLTRIRWDEPRETETGLWIVKSWWGRKRGKQITEVFLPYIFETLGMHRLVSTVNVANGRAIGSRRPRTRLSEHEGTFRKAVYHHGRFHDVHVFVQKKSDPGIALSLECIRHGEPIPD